ncbi:MAG: glycine betaine ABC transporter substrate-binding protein [Gammaproteobacteria bacterium]|nr:glycine betaine ABC transporter substrate-binding protein [Gammaproteobacteria bacterium]
MHLLKKFGALVALYSLSVPSFAANCGSVTISEMNWPSAEFLANLDKIILEEAFGCSVELVPGATVTTFASMESKGEPDIAPELWTNGVVERFTAAVEKGDIISGTKLIQGASEGWFISQNMHEKHPELKTVDDVLARPDLFPNKENPSNGAFYGCPSGWGCQISNINLAKKTAFDFEGHNFDQIDPGSGAALAASIAKAYERKEPWFGYYWQPTGVLYKYPMHKLDWGVPHDKENWDNCVSKDPECPNPKKNGWTESTVVTAMTSDFHKKNPELVKYLNKRTYGMKTVGGVLAYMSDNQANGEDAAFYFLQNYETVWSEWLSADQAKKVKKAL